MKIFNKDQLNNLFKPSENSSNEQNGQVTIIGGSKLFHGAPILSLKVASRFNDMVFFASPEPSVGEIAEKIKSELMSFIWVPWEDIERYVEKSDAVLIGPGFMRYKSEKQPHFAKASRGKQNLDKEGGKTRKITRTLLKKFPEKRWVIDAGSLQVMEAECIPEGAIITPNKKEFEMLFGHDKVLRSNSVEQNSSQDDKADENTVSALSNIKAMAEEYKCTIVLKGSETLVCSPNKCTVVKGGNAGLTKGGSGDILAGLTVSLYAKNDAHLSACAASYIEKKAADELFEKVGTNYSADDLAVQIPLTIATLRK
ncbi:NAD(P)H-hydrate dehydratase [Candidatus Woesebacteria bacterium]|nr:NAD(P)H-hydrate dehydratase [Candidatus Woesebacteria bacterium]